MLAPIKIRNILILIPILAYFQTIGKSKQTVRLVDFNPSQCDEREDPLRIKTRIVQQGFEGDIFKVEIGTAATCCVNFIPSIEFKNKVLHLRFQETGDECGCQCCYQFVYHISGLKEKEFTIQLQDKKIAYS